MPAPQLVGNRSATTEAIGSPGRSRASVIRRTVFAVFVIATPAVYLVATAPTMLSAVGALAGASPVWLLTGLAATVASMVAFAALRGRTLAAGGARIPLRRTLAVSYGAGAVHTTLPAGALFSTTYAFRHLRSWGASASATTWSMTVTGLLSTLTLAGVGLLGLVLSAGTAGSMLLPIVEIVAAFTVVVALVRLARRPDGLIRWAYLALIGVNRLRHRPAQTGAVRLAGIVADLRQIRPSWPDWAVAATLALANWVLDLACLAACCAAVGVLTGGANHVGFPALLLTYTAGMAAGSLLPLPAGLGAVETAMTLSLTVAGAATAPALAAVLLYRLVSTGSVVLLGGLVVASQRLHGGTSKHSPAVAR